MKKILAVLLLLGLTATAGQAQLIKLGIGAELPLPTGTFGDVVSSGFGGTAIAKLKIPIVDIYGAVDYLNFGEKEITGTGTTGSVKNSATMWGINAGATISLFVVLYGGVEVGSYIISQKTETAGAPATTSDITRGAIAPVVGASFTMFDLSARYVIMENTDFFVVRGAIFF